MREGRSLDSLLAAYRVGARVAWRHLSDWGLAAGLEAETLVRLAEAIFAYIDGLSAESAEGYAQERAAAAGERQRRREELATLLVQSLPPDEASAEQAARAGGWELPERLAVVAIRDGDPQRLAGRVGPDVLGATIEGVPCLLVPDPVARRAVIEHALRRVAASIGPTVPWPRASLSFARARAAIELASVGGGLIVAEDRLLDLFLDRDRVLAQDLADRYLAPLESLSKAQRARLEETLLAWLESGFAPTAAARVLHVHPQTVRYRLRRLRDLFGEGLENPDVRFGLELGLRIRDRETSGRAPTVGS
jgi:hypothetical protein